MTTDASPPPAVSVILPVYNAALYLEEAIESILAQDFEDFELIAVNDGSKDRSGEILDAFAARDLRVRVVHQANEGCAAARNAALALSRGELIAMMDSDDVALPTRFGKQVAWMRAHPDYLALGTGVTAIDPGGDPIAVITPSTDPAEVESELLEKRGGKICNPSAMLRAAAVRELGGWDVAFDTADDYELFLRLSERGRVGNLAEQLLRYRWHLSSLCHTRAGEMGRKLNRAIRAARARRGLPEIALEDPVATATSDPAAEAMHVVEQLRRWSHAASSSGFGRAARKHAWAALRMRPTLPRAWYTLFCATVGEGFANGLVRFFQRLRGRRPA